MKKQLLFFLILILTSLNVKGQVTFEKGYFINNQGNKTECLIENFDWKNNPSEIVFKLTENSHEETLQIKNIKQFEIYDKSKYVKFDVKIDKSSDKINQLTKTKFPEFTEETLLLKVLIEGDGSLYSYNSGDLARYFYKIKDSKITQLVYKRYEVISKEFGRSIAENNQYQQQLYTDARCNKITLKEIKKIKYKKDNLVDFFIKYNNCLNSDFKNIEKDQKKDLFKLTIRPRFNNFSLEVQNSTLDNRNFKFDNKSAFGFGIELEYILPFNKNKWSISIEPTYQSSKLESTIDASNVSGGKLTAITDYKSIEIPFSLRHYFFLKNDSKLFANFSIILDKASNSKMELKRNDGSILNTYDIGSRNNIGFGFGYKLKDIYSIEIRFLSSREILDNYIIWSSDYKTTSIIFGYSIF